MPPPLQNNTGSRAALITWTVVTSILFVVSTVLAIAAHVAENKVAVELDTLTKKYADIVSPTDLDGDVISGLKSVKGSDSAAYPTEMKLLNVALKQRDNLATVINGTTGEDNARKDAQTAMDLIKANPAIKSSGTSLVAVVKELNDAVKSGKDQIDQLTAGEKDRKKQLDDLKADASSQLALFTKKNADLDDARRTAEDSAAAYRSEKDKQNEEMQAKLDTDSKLSQDSVNQLNAQKKEQEDKAKKLEDQIKALQTKLHDIRQPVNQILRQADAKVMRTAGDNVLYIDLGTGDQVVAGMTFEVYDHVQGIPNPGDPTNNDNLPKGKASIEIIKVSAGSSECRIVRQTPGEIIVEGDLCVNVVYDKAVKYNIMVYGNFDLDRNGQATAADTDVIKRLVTQWGGKVTDKLNADTDFLVIGKLPEIPSYTQEELDRPEIQFEVERKKKELADYDETLAHAIELNIPVLNQNRFLYFTGYYEQSAR